jgi:hypothetical protein
MELDPEPMTAMRLFLKSYLQYHEHVVALQEYAASDNSLLIPPRRMHDFSSECLEALYLRPGRRV